MSTMNKNLTYHSRGVLIDGYSAEKHPSYVSWVNMKSRCKNPSAPGYKNYGGRGITYCLEWEHFANFAKDMGVRPSPKHSLERIDNNKGYSPENCKWATRSEQCLNRRRFSNNQSGFTGVVKKRGRYVARYMNTTLAGSFATAEEAAKAREQYIVLFNQGVDVSHLVERKARYDSSTGIKGITRHQDGGYLVRVTFDKKRIYLGYFKDFKDAKRRLEQWQPEQN